MSKDEIRFEPDGEPFQVPLPPPFPPPHGGDRVFWIRTEDDEGAQERKHEDLMLRRVPKEIAMRFRAGAGGRGMTHAQYLVALVELHARVRGSPRPATSRLAPRSTSSACRASPSES